MGLFGCYGRLEGIVRGMAKRSTERQSSSSQARSAWLVDVLAWRAVILIGVGALIGAGVSLWMSHARFAQMVRLVDAVAWPVAALVAIIALRRELPHLLGRVSKVSVASVSLELAMPREPAPSAMHALQELGDPLSTDALSDSSGALFRALTGRGRADVLALHLGTGGSWLTTRLYVVSTLVCDALGLRCIVFTTTEGAVSQRFVGIAEPAAIRHGLEAEFSWLPAAMLGAGGRGRTDWPKLTSALDAKEPDRTPAVIGAVFSLATAQAERRDQNPPEMVLMSFLNDPTVRRQAKAGDPVAPGWVRLEKPSADGTTPTANDEHAEWITPTTLERLLGDRLTRSVAVKAPGVGRRELFRQALLADDAFVAVVDDDRRFLRVIERGPLVERIAEQAAEVDGS